MGRGTISNSIKLYGLLSLVSFSVALILLNRNMLASSPIQSETGPLAAECVYSISSHVLQCRSTSSSQTGPITVGPQSVTSGSGDCRDNPQCVGRKYKKLGPVEPGKYKMNPDTHVGGAERVRLEPIPPRAGWRVWLPSWMPGSLRGGFLMGIGTSTHGCIVVLKEDDKASAQYKRMLQLLDGQPSGINELVVIP